MTILPSQCSCFDLRNNIEGQLAVRVIERHKRRTRGSTVERGEVSKEIVHKILQKRVSGSCKCRSNVKLSLMQLRIYVYTACPIESAWVRNGIERPL